MTASATDYFKAASTSGVRPVPTTLAAIHTIAGTTITAVALTGWPTATGVAFIIYNTDTSGNKVAGSQTDWSGVVSGSTITGMVLKGGTDQNYSIGAIVECAPTAGWADDIVTGITAHANQDGSLIGSVVRTALGQSASAGSGWTTLGVAPSSITANGNRSYQVVFSGSDQTGTLSNGMRLLMQRTVAAPTKSTSLNGTTQYYSKSSPNKMTFTDDFVVSAWIKINSYADMTIASRYNGTSGWAFRVTSTGILALAGFNAGASNYSQVLSYQSVPLNKWVHVAAQLDMSAFTATTTTSYVMIDGVDMPAQVARAGSNPTALIQAGNLNIGAENGGTAPFNGKLAQVAVYNAKVTQATILASLNRTLAGTETSLASGYSFNNSVADLNTTTPNDLTAQGSAVATSTDSPFAQSATAGTLEYGIITACAFSTDTTLSVQVPEGSELPTTGGITAVSYSGQKIPYGFPAQRTKWEILTEFCLSDVSQTSLSTGTVYNLSSSSILKVPAGEWKLDYAATTRMDAGSTGATEWSIGIGASSSTYIVDSVMNRYLGSSTTLAVAGYVGSTNVSPTTLTTYYLNYKPITGSGTLTGYIATTTGTTKFRAEPTYL